MLLPNKIILHCSATADTDSKSWEAIRRYHVEDKGWDDIGYHYGIENVGGDIMVFRGRPWWIKGAHCVAEGRNHDSLGLCVVGKYDDEPPAAEIYIATIDVLKILCAVFSIDPDQVYGHGEFEPLKTCPGRMWNMDDIRANLVELVPEVGSEQGIKIGEML